MIIDILTTRVQSCKSRSSASYCYAARIVQVLFPCSDTTQLTREKRAVVFLVVLQCDRSGPYKRWQCKWETGFAKSSLGIIGITYPMYSLSKVPHSNYLQIYIATMRRTDLH